MMKACIGCGQQSPISATFCTHCGAALSTSQSSQSGRPVVSMRGPNSPPSAQPTAHRESQPVLPTLHSSQPSSQSPYQPATTQSLSAQPTGSRSSTKVIAVSVIALVAIVAGILIFAGNNDSQPEQARPSSGQVTPNDSDAYEEADASDYYPTQNYSSWDDFPAYYRSNFLNACMTESTYELCLCALETMEANFTLDEVLEVEAAESYGEDVSWFYSAIAAECI